MFFFVLAGFTFLFMYQFVTKKQLEDELRRVDRSLLKTSIKTGENGEIARKLEESFHELDEMAKNNKIKTDDLYKKYYNDEPNKWDALTRAFGGKERN